MVVNLNFFFFFCVFQTLMWVYCAAGRLICNGLPVVRAKQLRSHAAKRKRLIINGTMEYFIDFPNFDLGHLGCNKFP